jgi:hypothetical protein
LSKKKTHEEFIQQMETVDPNIEILSHYENNRSLIKCKCKIDGYEWVTQAVSLTQGRSKCKKCIVRKRTITHEEFLEEMATLHPNIEVLGHYVNRVTYVKLRCKIDGYEWSKQPKSLINNRTGCAKCARNAKLTHTEFIQQVSELYPNVKILSTYSSMRKKIHCKCNIDHYEWYPTPEHLTRRLQGCPICSGHRVMSGINDMWTTNPDLAKLLLNRDDGFIYAQKSNKKVWWKCPFCGQELYKTISDVCTQGLSCSRCSDNISYANKFAYSMLDQLDIDFKSEYSPDWLKPKRYDFYFLVHDKPYVLEMDGIQHFQQSFPLPYENVIQNDKYKERMAIEHGIKLIRIDCRDRDQIVSNIYDSELHKILNLSRVDWDKCYYHTHTSKKLEFFILYNQGIKMDDISKQIHIHKATLYRWLRNDFVVTTN